MTSIKIDHHHHHNRHTIKKYSIASLAMISLLFAALICLCISAPFSISFLTRQHLSSKVTVKDYLEEALEKAAMASKSKTVIITIINKAYVEPVNDENPSMLDLFLERFWEGEGTRPLADRLLVVAMDRTAYQRSIFRRLHCYRLRNNAAGGGGVDYASEKLYLSRGFVRMMWRRTLFLPEVLKRGHRRNVAKESIQTARPERYRRLANKHRQFQRRSNPIDTSFYDVRSNNKTIAVFELWYSLRETYPSRMKEQDVLEIMKRNGWFEELGLVVRCLDVLYLSGFCNENKDISTVYTVHVNSCRTIRTKVIDLRNVLRY